MDYPKILVLNQYFISTQNGGITRKNIFSEWPKNKIAFVAKNIDEDCKAFSPNYYIIKTKSKFKNRYINKAINFFDDKNEYCFSEEYIKWISDFCPDIIYAVPDSISFIQFIKKTADVLNKSFALHISDDFVEKDLYNSIIYYFHLKKLKSEFVALINKANVLFSICEEMSSVYRKRYGLIFHPIFNPVDLEKFKFFTKRNWVIDGPFKMFYAGSITAARLKSLYDICHVVEQLTNEKYEIILDIYSNIQTEMIKNKINSFKGVKLHDPVEKQIDIISKLPIYDLLIMPISFTKKAKSTLKLSMSTNTAEFMHSGTPILVYAPSSVAVAKFAIESKWGQTISDRNPKFLRKEIIELINSEEKRKELGIKARDIAINKFSSEKVRKDFLLLINQSIRNPSNHDEITNNIY